MKKIILLAALAMVMTLPSCARKNADNAPSVNENSMENNVNEKKNYKVKTLPLAVKDKILETIQSDYKGKVVFIDLWATWCGPCRHAMLSVDSIKPELMKKGAKFVYITGETSPEKTWSEMIQKIDGDHYRLTKDQWNTLCKEQEIRGIPCYKLVGKDGTTAFTNLTEGGYPGNEIIKPAIEKALEKK